MVMNVARAMAWGVSTLLGLGREERAGHGEVEHLHWDRTERRWRAHDDEHRLGRREAA